MTQAGPPRAPHSRLCSPSPPAPRRPRPFPTDGAPHQRRPHRERHADRHPDAPTSTPSTLTPTTPTPTVSWQDGPTVTGVDVSRYNPEVDWQHLAATGHRFAYVKATEGTGHRSLTYDAQAAGARDAGLFVGGYHYARPGSSDGATQARFFAEHGAAGRPTATPCPARSISRRTPPGTPATASPRPAARLGGGLLRRVCRRHRPVPRDLRQGRHVAHVPRRRPAARPGQHLWLYDHGDAPGELPPGWEQPTFWQRAIEDGLDRNVFYGTVADLARLAVDPHS